MLRTQDMQTVSIFFSLEESFMHLTFLTSLLLCLRDIKHSNFKSEFLLLSRLGK